MTPKIWERRANYPMNFPIIHGKLGKKAGKFSCLGVFDVKKPLRVQTF